MLHKRFKIQWVFFLTLFVWGSIASAQPSVDEGKALFKANCAACHARDMKSKLTGPALGGVEERWADYPQEDLYKWIRTSQSMIEEGHPLAKELWAEWQPTVMNNFPNLTDDQIAGILLYIDQEWKKKDEVADTVADAGAAKDDGNTMFYVGLLGILALLALILWRIISSLNRMADEKEGLGDGHRKTMVQQLLDPKVIGFVIFALVLVLGYKTVNNAIDLGRQQGYAPTQPIKFSHATHAGIQKIDCEYCHDGARRSKHSVIPATNTCMNCHSAVKVGSKYGTAELTKIYASAGYDPIKGAYFPDTVTLEDKTNVYKQWIATNFKDAKGEDWTQVAQDKEVARQWEAIKGQVGKPIEWVKIHNLPDHVYFNHAQHVSVGKVECQDCHGKVEEMEVVEQHSPLSMGWCVNCHRQTKVQFADNPYYDNYEAYHKELANPASGRTGVTVEEIGGLECQKCHY